MSADNLPLSANITWFRVFQDMVFNGEAALLGPFGFTVYCVIKAHASLNTGEAFPGIDLIAKEGGLSRAQVKRQLDVLEEKGYLTRTKETGRNNNYQLREKIAITDDGGETTAIAWWDYVPLGMKAALADLKNVTMTGDLNGAKIINIQHMVVNINAGSGNQANFNGDVGTIPEGPLGDSLRKLMKRRDES